MLEHDMDIGPIFEDFNTPAVPKLSKPEKSTDSELLAEYNMDKAIFVEDVKEYVNTRNVLK